MKKTGRDIDTDTDVHGGEVFKLAREFGFGSDSRKILDFSANINPCGFPEWTRAYINRSISDLKHYPDKDYFELRNSIARKYNLALDNIVVLNGLSEIFAFFPYIFAKKTPITLIPSFSEYIKPWMASQDDQIKTKIKFINLNETDNFQVTKQIWENLEESILSVGEKNALIYLAHPNNPTGKLLNINELNILCKRYQDAIFIIDEAFIDFVNVDMDMDDVNLLWPNLKLPMKNTIILRSLTKIMAIPGLRLAFAVTSNLLAKQIQKVLPTWNVNMLAAELGVKYFKENTEDTEGIENIGKKIYFFRRDFVSKLHPLQKSIKIFEGDANFILLKFLTRSSKEIVSKLIKNYFIAVRDASTFNGMSDDFIRVAVKQPEENLKLVEALEDILNESKSNRASRRSLIRPLMLAGTGSSVGKSILTAGLLRIFYQDGLHVAPFKAQNMSLNSYVTIHGEEIGRAQGLQAQAAAVVADARMNPILLKPNNDNSSQVILNGKPITNMHYSRYADFKQEAFKEVKRAYDSLKSEYQLIVMEGAGSISEVNLKQNDLVNMNMARYANANVYLVGDIDRGGVFGQFIGTITTLSEWEKDLIKGFIINRFRGIESLLKDGIDYLQNITSIPTIGVVPYLKDIKLPDEDSLEFTSGKFHDDSALGDRIDIAVIDLPKISNFTDLDPFRFEKDVRLRVVKNVSELAEPDLIIIPGSKNVIYDYKVLMDLGLDRAIHSLATSKKSFVFGICGGYQMLGEKITDPFQIESTLGEIKTLGLLAIVTELQESKKLVQTKGIHLQSKLPVDGYEIHHGTSNIIGQCNETIISAQQTKYREKQEPLAISSLDGKIHGTYLHGIFDNDEFRRYFLDQIHLAKGKTPVGKINYVYSVEKSLDALAETLRTSLDIKKIYTDIGF